MTNPETTQAAQNGDQAATQMPSQERLQEQSMASTIEHKINAALKPSYLEVINESDNHNVPKGSESHFKLIVVSAQFEGQRTLHRHRMVYAVLEQELAGSVHALALHTYTDEQWNEIEQAPDSPNCRGGMKVEAEQEG